MLHVPLFHEHRTPSLNPGLDSIFLRRAGHLEMLVYKHEELAEWVVIKMIRVIQCQASISDGGHMRHIQVMLQIKIHSYNMGEAVEVTAHLGCLLPACTVHGVMDLILVYLRSQGDFTPSEIQSSIGSWTFEGKAMKVKAVREQCIGYFRRLQTVQLPAPSTIPAASPGQAQSPAVPAAQQSNDAA